MRDSCYNDFLTTILTFLIVILGIVAIIWMMLDDKPREGITCPIVNTRIETETKVVEVPVVKYKYIPAVQCLEVPYRPEERDLLAALVHAEAGNQDQVRKRLVVDVILNRVDSEDFPDTVQEVVKQANQFITPSSAFTADDLKAVDAELNERLDYDILYFRTGHHHSCGSPAYQHGDHYFNYEKEK